MARRLFSALIVAILAVTVFSLSSVSALACGDTVYTNTVLDSDMTCSSDRGLYVAPNVTLDCAGHSITGAGGAYGIDLVSNGATVKNCVVTKFSSGIGTWSNSSTIIGNTVTSNGIGISIFIGYNNILTNNNASNNNAGIYLASGNNNTIYNNIANNNRDGIVLTSSNNNALMNNTANYNNNSWLAKALAKASPSTTASITFLQVTMPTTTICMAFIYTHPPIIILILMISL